MRSDGSVIIDTKILDDGMQKGFESLKNGMESVGVTAENIGKKIKLSFSDMDLSKPIGNAVDKVKSLEQQLSSVTSQFNLAIEYDDDKAAEKLGKKRESIYNQLELARKKLARTIIQETKKEEIAERKSAENITKAKQREANKQAKAAMKPLRQFGTRLGSLVSGALVFNIISAGLRNMMSYFGKALKSNDAFRQSMARLKGALLTAFQPIYETVMPALIAFMNVLAAAAQRIGQFFATLTGKSYAETAKNAESLYNEANAIESVGKEAKKAKKYIAGFDELNVMGNKESNEGSLGSSTNITANFKEFDTDQYKSKIDELTAYLSMSLLGLGAILAFSGVNIPLGIGLMAAGAAGLATVTTLNWNAIKEKMKGPVGKVVAIVSGSLIALGAILAFTGVGIPLGIALMAAGAAGLATTTALNWNELTNKVKKAVSNLATSITTKWGELKEKLTEPFRKLKETVSNFNLSEKIEKIKKNIRDKWQGLKSILSSPFDAIVTKISGIAGKIKTAWKSGINSVITILNKFIRWLNNTLSFTIPPITVLGKTIFAGKDITLANIPQIPYLAQGAVIPPNAPFMAMLGDQRHGTNIEAPLSTIQEAVANVMEDFSAANMAGHSATVEVLREILEAVLGIEIGDDVIAKAVQRQNSKMAIVRGG